MKGVRTTIGGACLNAARASAYWMKKDGKKGKIAYIGSIGKDDIGKKVARKTKADGVEG